MSLQGKTAIVTGASSGIGKGAALKLAEEGANVVLFARRQDRLDEIVKEITDKGGNAVAVTGDVTKKADNQKAVDVALEKYGGLDISFLNAGVGDFKNILDYSEEEFDFHFDVNVKGVFFGLQTHIPALEKSEKNPSIIVNSSAMSDRVKKGISNRSGVYSATKAAVNRLVEVAALEHGPKIRVNAIKPGLVSTEIIKMDKASYDSYAASMQLLPRSADPEEIADFVAFLASDKSLFFHGAILPIDGGFRL